MSGRQDDCSEALPRFVRKMQEACPEGSLKLILSRKLSYSDFRYIESKTRTELKLEGEVLSVEGSERGQREAVMEVLKMKGRKRSRSPREERVTTSVTVPDSMVARLIGRKGDHVRVMMDKSGCSITFHKKPEGVKTPEGEIGRLCTLRGTTFAISVAVKTLLEEINKLERD